MEHRNDLAEILLSGLPDDERSHVVEVIRQGDAEKLRHKRESEHAPLTFDERVDEEHGADV